MNSLGAEVEEAKFVDAVASNLARGRFLLIKSQFLEVNPDVLEQVDPIFYGDLRQAAFKALGLN
jgi:hypothetical protein